MRRLAGTDGRHELVVAGAIEGKQNNVGLVIWPSRRDRSQRTLAAICHDVVDRMTRGLKTEDGDQQ
jgi:hypothetical protein